MLLHLERDDQHPAMITSGTQMMAGHAALSTIQRCDRERWWTWCWGRTTRAKLALGFDGYPVGNKKFPLSVPTGGYRATSIMTSFRRRKGSVQGGL